MTGRPWPIGEVGDRAAAVAGVVARAAARIPSYARLAGMEHRPLADLPTFTKADLEGFGPVPLADPGRLDGLRWHATSGTTGARLLVGFSPADWRRLRDQLAGRAAAVGLGRRDLLANTHGYGLWIGGPTLDRMATTAGAGLLPVGPGQTDQLLRWLADLPVTAMSATPSYLRFLAERIERDGVDTSRWSLRLGLVGGEPSSVELKAQALCSLPAGFRWQELYGTAEVGGPVLGWTPPDEPMADRLLVDTDELVVEVLHPDRDEPVAPGETGEVTVTTPYREACPLVRYRTRDLVVRHADGGGPWPSVSRVIGRVDDAIKVRGTLVYPSAVEHVVLTALAPGAEWRVRVDRRPGALDELVVVVEADGDGAGIRRRLTEALGVRTEVEVVPLGSLDRFEGKARRITVGP